MMIRDSSLLFGPPCIQSFAWNIIYRWQTNYRTTGITVLSANCIRLIAPTGEFDIQTTIKPKRTAQSADTKVDTSKSYAPSRHKCTHSYRSARPQALGLNRNLPGHVIFFSSYPVAW